MRLYLPYEDMKVQYISDGIFTTIIYVAVRDRVWENH